MVREKTYGSGVTHYIPRHGRRSLVTNRAADHQKISRPYVANYYSDVPVHNFNYGCFVWSL